MIALYANICRITVVAPSSSKCVHEKIPMSGGYSNGGGFLNNAGWSGGSSSSGGGGGYAGRGGGFDASGRDVSNGSGQLL